MIDFRFCLEQPMVAPPCNTMNKLVTSTPNQGTYSRSKENPLKIEKKNKIERFLHLTFLNKSQNNDTYDFCFDKARLIFDIEIGKI